MLSIDIGTYLIRGFGAEKAIFPIEDYTPTTRVNFLQ